MFSYTFVCIAVCLDILADGCFHGEVYEKIMAKAFRRSWMRDVTNARVVRTREFSFVGR